MTKLEKLKELEERIAEKEEELNIVYTKEMKVKNECSIKRKELNILKRERHILEAEDNYLLKKEIFEKEFRHYLEYNLLNKLVEAGLIKMWDGEFYSLNENRYFIAFDDFGFKQRQGKLSVNVEWLNE